jgi:hypothetical protein
MSVLLLDELKNYNALLQGLQWWSDYENKIQEIYIKIDEESPLTTKQHQATEHINYSFGIEGCKYRLRLRSYMKLFDYLVENKLFIIAKIDEETLLGKPPNYKTGETHHESVMKHIHLGLEMMLAQTKLNKIGEKYGDPRWKLAKPYWTYCVHCSPKGVHCMVSLSVDILDIFSELGFLRKTTSIILNKMDKHNFSNDESEDDDNLKNKLMDFIKWSEDSLDVLNKNILFCLPNTSGMGSTIEGMIIKELRSSFIKREIPSKNILEKNIPFYGWPVIIQIPKESKEDPRSLLINQITKKDNSDPKNVRENYAFIKKLDEKGITLQKFSESEADRIDPRTTAFIIKYLFYCHDTEETKKFFLQNVSEIKNCIKTLLLLYEGPISRNESVLKDKSDCENTINLFDGAWMNFEYIPSPGSPLEPDYSLNSSLDIASILMFLQLDNKNIDGKDREQIEKINKTLTDYITKKRLPNTNTKDDLVKRLDAAHASDRYCENISCAFSDIYGTIKMLDYLLNRALFFIIEGRYHDAAKIINETPCFSLNFKWVIERQCKDGYWPPVSTSLLDYAFKNEQIWKNFQGYFDMLGFAGRYYEDNGLINALGDNKIKTISYVNTIEALVLQSKYFYVKLLISIFES